MKLVGVHSAAAGFRRKPSCGQSLPADGDFDAAFSAARLAMLADGAEIAEVCNKPGIKLTIDLDTSLADRLNPERNDWQQIYHLLKTQKNCHPEG